MKNNTGYVNTPAPLKVRAGEDGGKGVHSIQVFTDGIIGVVQNVTLQKAPGCTPVQIEPVMGIESSPVPLSCIPESQFP